MAIAAVRAAAAPDVDEIVRIQADTWAAAYAELVPPAAIEQLRGPQARQAWAGAVEADAAQVVVATEGQWTVGFVAAAVAEPPGGTETAGGAESPGGTESVGGTESPGGTAAVPGGGVAEPGGTAADGPADGARLGPGAWGEIGALLVEPRWGRRGHGGRLLAAAAEALRGSGALYGLAWVPEADEASRRFYARAGWEPDGAVRAFDTGEGTLREIRLTGSLDLKLQD